MISMIVLAASYIFAEGGKSANLKSLNKQVSSNTERIEEVDVKAENNHDVLIEVKMQGEYNGKTLERIDKRMEAQFSKILQN